MKRKLILALVLPVVAMATTSCGLLDKLFHKDGGDTQQKDKTYAINFDISGGTDQEKQAMLQAANGIIATMNGASTTNLQPNNPTILKEDEGSSLTLYTKKEGKALDKSKHNVVFEWGFNNSQYIGTKYDDTATNSKKVSINYKGWTSQNKNGPDTSDPVQFEVTKITCGGATATAPNIKYTCNVQNQLYHHVATAIEELNKATDGEVTHNGNKYPSTFDLVDYTQTSPYFKKDPENEGLEKDYYYVDVKGKIIYYAPDGDWAILADGDQYIELFAGSARNLTPAHYPAMASDSATGGWVTVSGNMSQYCGNIQIGFITKIEPLANHSSCEDPEMSYKDIDFSKFEVNIDGLTCQKQAIDGFSNSLAKVEGTFVAGSLKQDNKATTGSALTNARFTFDVKTDAQDVLTIAYDYHTDLNGDVGLFNKLKTYLSKAQPGKCTIKGSMRYSGKDSDPFILTGNPGIWTLVPFEANHIVEA